MFGCDVLLELHALEDSLPLDLLIMTAHLKMLKSQHFKFPNREKKALTGVALSNVCSLSKVYKIVCDWITSLFYCPVPRQTLVEAAQ